MTLRGLLLLIFGLVIARFLGRTYYKDRKTRVISFLLLLLVSFFAAWLALQYSHELLRTIKPMRSLWTGFLLSSIIAFVSLILGYEDQDNQNLSCACTNSNACICDDVCTCKSTHAHSDNAYQKMIDDFSSMFSDTTSSTNTNNTKKSTPPDDLKVIEGIGPVIESFLYEQGVSTYVQLAAMNPDQIRSILDRAGDKFISHTTESRPLQARFAQQQKRDKLQELKDELNSGRFVVGKKEKKKDK